MKWMILPGMTGIAALTAGTGQLRDAGLPDPARDARRLLAHALQIAPDRLTLVLPEPLPADARTRFDAALAERRRRRPVAQIVGERLFWGRAFTVTSDVLDPRPETETLVALALEAPFQHVLDLGTGSGCILLSLLAERPQAVGCGVDVSPKALAVAQANAVRHGLSDRARWVQSDWFQEVQGRFDLIVSNPPYIAASEMPGLSPDVRDWEPAQALTDGGDGLSAYRTIAAQAATSLAPGGRLMVEIGPTQGQAVAKLFREAGLETVARHPDLDGRDRVVSGHATVMPNQQERGEPRNE